MESWFAQAEAMTPGYRKAASLVMQSGSGQIIKTYTLMNLFPTKRATPDLDMGNEGELALLTWTFKGDTALPT